METILEKQVFLAEVIHKCLHQEPQMTLEDIAVVLSEEIEDISDFLKIYKKHLKKRL